MNLNIKFIKSSINLHSNKIQNNVSMQSEKKLLVLTKISSKSGNAHDEFFSQKDTSEKLHLYMAERVYDTNISSLEEKKKNLETENTIDKVIAQP